MKRHWTSISAVFFAAALSACVYVNDASSDLEDTYREANLEGSSYKAMLPNDPTFQTVAVLQAASGDYVAHVTMTGADAGSKYRLVVVERGSDGNFVSKGVVLH